MIAIKQKHIILYKKLYDVLIILLAVTSIIFAILDICGKMSTINPAFKIADNVILIIFAIDYIVRFIFSKNKWIFFKKNIFDLIAIIPFNTVFSFFRFARLFRLAKFARLLKFTKFVRLAGVLGRFKNKSDKFLKTNGFIYMLYASVTLIIISAVIMSYLEKQSFSDALWWSIVTCTTVGYGDISPSTGAGRVVAVVLMIFGIGFISMLTGTITTYFNDKIKNPPEDPPQTDEINALISEMSDDELKQLSIFAKAIKSGLIK